ncbi:MAG TPA: protein translocase subunit SecD, partial [Firmicutes bacterium]|nr:protein translocase subunit SecD [Bacillota bacterium]
MDIAGGLYVLLEAETTGDEEVDADAIERAIAIIRMRVDDLGVAEPSIIPQGTKRIRIELPQVDDEEQAREIIGKTALLTFTGPDGKEIVTGAHLTKAIAERHPQTGQPIVTIEFNEQGAKLFAEATGRYLEKPIYISLDQEVISSPVIRSVIPDGSGYIEGNFTFEEAANLALLLRSGSLPLEFKELETRLIGPTLGQR